MTTTLPALPAAISLASNGNKSSHGKKVVHTAANPFKKKLCGDIFGSSMLGENSMLGMLYRSRIEKSSMLKAHLDRGDDNSTETGDDEKAQENNDIFDGSSDSENENEEAMNPRHRLALTIRNWSVNPENDDYLIKEGAVHALIALAGTDDHHIKQCCASALYHLSCRHTNRTELISLGAATGVIVIALAVRHWKIAKLCAQTLCNFSMEPGGEAALAREGAVLAILILLGVRNHKLAPTCVQALYNLTCVKEPFKGMERIIKALLTLPSVNFDATPAVIGGVVNFSRFPNLRLRIIEDGALQTFAAVVNSISHKDCKQEEKDEIIYKIACSIVQLSESVNCRGDMISKGALELLQQLLMCSNDRSRLLVIKALHNFLSVVHTFPTTIFEIGVNLVTDIINQTYDEVVLQYSAACFYIFTLDNLRGISRLAIRVVKVLPRLLMCANSLTQYYAIITTSLMFFGGLIEDVNLLMTLAGKAIEAGYTVNDPASVRALVRAFSQLTQEEKYLIQLEKDKLLTEMLSLLLKMTEFAKIDNIILESCCVGVCRICLQIKLIEPGRRKKIASLLNSLLDLDDCDMLLNVVSSIRALLENGICHDELLSEVLISKIANITQRFAEEISLRRMGSAVLTVLSYDAAAHCGLSTPEVMAVLCQMTRCDDILTRELIAACLCNMSVDNVCRIRMIEFGVVAVIASLSGSTSERIQELCAKCICNLTCTVDMHKTMIKNNILQTTLMIALVRSVSNGTKLLSARALLNMISDENLQAIIEAGVVRVFSSLSLLDDVHTQQICARGFLMLSSTSTGREAISQKRSVLQSLFSLVKALSSKTRVLMGKALYNLLADAMVRQRVIKFGALSVLKIISTQDNEELREGAAEVIIILAQSKDLGNFIFREPIVPVLALILKSSTKKAFECALNAFSCLSQNDLFRKTLIEKGAVSAIVGAVINGKIYTVPLAEEACRCLCLLSFSYEHAEIMIFSEHILFALHIIQSQAIVTQKIAEMIGVICKNLSCNASVCSHIVNQDGLKLMGKLMFDYAVDSMSLISSTMLFFA